jgi:signal transduction histidine kinase
LSRVSKQPTDVDSVPEASPVAAHSSPFISSGVTGMNNNLNESLSTSPGIAYECSSDLKVLTLSANAVELIGIKPERQFGSRILWGERLLPEDRRRLVARLDELTELDVALEVHRLIDDRGLPVWVCHSFKKVRTNSDTIIRGCLIPLPKDFNERIFGSGSIAQFVHRIGNHFQLINLLIGSLRRGGKVIDEIESLQQTIDRAAEFTRTFLHYSQTPSSMSEVDLGEVLRSVFYLNVPRFFDKNVKFEDLVHDSLDGTLVNGDPFLLDLAFGAILRNALDATTSGDRVTVSGKRQVTCAPARSSARISIRDTGVGIEEESLEKAAMPFFSTKPEQDGLGLSMAMRIFDNHGGLLSISSTKGHGTEVEVVLPVCDTTD